MITRNNFNSFVPSILAENYSIHVEHLRLFIQDHSLFTPSEHFLKTMKKLVQIHPKLSSFIVEFGKRYEGQFRLRTQLESLFQSSTTKRISVYPTPYDFAFRFCFDEQINDDDRSSMNSETHRMSFCGIPFGSIRKQRRRTLVDPSSI